MGGGLMQLVAYGAQDIYLTGNPQITFFKVVYRRHTNFSMEAIQQTWNGTQPGPGRCSATISRNGDLVYRMYIQIKLPASGTIAHENPSSSGITDVTLEIGGQQIDKHSGQWMETWAQLTEKNPSGTTAATALTDAATSTLFQRMSGMGGVKRGGTGDGSLKYIPLYFWFCRNPGLALPLIALQYHEVKVILNHSFTTPYNVVLQELKLYADYIYLDTDERRRFAQVSHEYLIEQVQEQVSSASTTLDLNFNHPVKELIWSAARASGELVTPGAGNYQLKLNGHDRFATQDLTYFTRVQVKEYHTGTGGLDASTGGAGVFIDAIAVYSFALKPEEHQPSGTCNFSRIDNAQLVNPGTALTVYAVNYNVLRIMSGMGGLAYSN
jgi:hypothetical protein